jgi:hypothetical protein
MTSGGVRRTDGLRTRLLVSHCGEDIALTCPPARDRQGRRSSAPVSLHAARVVTWHRDVSWIDPRETLTQTLQRSPKLTLL